MTAREQVISADSHFVEPPEMWSERVDREFRDRAPHLVSEIDGVEGNFLVCEDLVPNSGGGFLAAGVDPADVAQVLQRGYRAAPDHVRNPAARLAAQDRDDVKAEVLYASYGMSLFHLADNALRHACFTAFNDWAAEYCRFAPSRLHGIGLIGLDDITAAVAELQRIAGNGLKGAMIWAEAPEERPYSHPAYEPFWAAAQDLDMKLALHSLTSRKKSFDADPANVVCRSVVLYQEVARTITEVILHGVLERFPRLKIVSAENEIAWLPFHLWRMDQLYQKLRDLSPVKLQMVPSEYFKRQIFATFIEDPLFGATIPYIGSGNIMWSSDFPHLASTWPHSHKLIDENMNEVSPDDRRRIVYDNAAALYGID
jgi:predicted TIM-barrel fold metal-dependent hydrolase